MMMTMTKSATNRILTAAEYLARREPRLIQNAQPFHMADGNRSSRAATAARG